MEIGSWSSGNLITGASGATPTPATDISSQQLTEQRQLIRAVKALNATDLFGQNSELTFVFDRQTQRALVRVIDKQTHEVVMQIPPEYVIRMAEENYRRL